MHINNRIANPSQQPTAWPQPEPSPGLDLTSCDPPDTSPPDAPAVTVVSNATSQTSVTLTWTESKDNPDPGGTGIGGYVVTRTGPGTATTFPTINPCGSASCSNSFTDVNLSVETTYSYQVVAFDNSQHGPNNGPGPNYSTPTSISAATLPDTAAPSVPSGLSATVGPDKQTSVLLSWSASTDPSPGTGVGGYYVYRNNALIYTTVSANETSYTDSGLSPDTAVYSYQVLAFDKSTKNPAHLGQPNVSEPATAAVTMPDITAPSQPGPITYSYTNGGATLTLSWGASTDQPPYATGIGGYNIYLLYQSGTPLTQKFVSNVPPYTPYTIQLQLTNQVRQFTVAVEAFDKSTMNPLLPGQPNVSPRTTAPVTCYDPDTDHDCDWSGHHD